MTRRYTYSTCINFGGDTPTAEVEVTVSYTVLWGAPEQGPSYASGGQPADPDEINDIKLELVEGKPRPWDTSHGYLSDDDFEELILEKLDNEGDYERMLENAADDGEQ